MELSYQKFLWDNLVVIFSSFFCLIIWFQTNAFVEYCNLLHVGKRFFKIKDFEKERELTGVSYPDYLEINYPSFFTSLIACPYCISVWLCVTGAIIYEDVLIVPFSYCALLFLYFSFSLVVKKHNEG